jgi:GR25 family glycosyltransferase involved in LPS biosynthesis
MKAFVISLSKIPSSAESSAKVLEKLLEYGFEAELFEGTYGYDAVELFHKDNRRIAKYGIKSIEIPIDEFKKRHPEIISIPNATNVIVRAELKNAGKVLRPGVIGCFYSHYRLWQKCIELNEPICIFEDDVIFERGYEPVEWEDVLLLCLGKETHKHEFYSKKLYNPEGTPEAVKLWNTSMPGAVGYAIKPHAAQKLIDYYKEEMLPADTAMNVHVLKLQCHTYIMGRAATQEDGKVSLTASKMWDQGAKKK